MHYTTNQSQKLSPNLVHLCSSMQNYFGLVIFVDVLSLSFSPALSFFFFTCIFFCLSMSISVGFFFFSVYPKSPNSSS